MINNSPKKDENGNIKFPKQENKKLQVVRSDLMVSIIHGESVVEISDPQELWAVVDQCIELLQIKGFEGKW